jgi:ribonuclease HI
MKPKITIYTDGACSGNPGPGGWGAVLSSGHHTKKIYGSDIDTTNNRMEIMASIKALEALKKPSEVILYTDSKYLQQGISDWIDSWIKNNWCGSNKKLVKNSDLWQTLYKLCQIHDVKWHWVKGHESNKGNIEADALAVRGRDEAKGA